METADIPSVTPVRHERFLIIALMLYAIALHSAFLAYDYSTDFASFYRVDRSDNRVDAMERLLAAETGSEISHTIANNNIILGEYIVQTGLFKIDGPLAVILFQTAMQLGSIFAVYRIARLALGTPIKGFISAALYATLPHSIAFPHQFASESLAIPMLVFTVWIVVEYLISDISWKWLMLAGFLCGLAACIRPVLIPMPACLALCVIAKRGAHRVRAITGLIGAGILPTALLMAFFFAATQHASLGNTFSSMGYNLYLRVLRTARDLPANDQKQIADHYFSGRMKEECIGFPVQPDGSSCELSLPDFVSFSLHYPLPTARFISRDLLTFVAKSGMSSVTANYLDLSENDERIKDYKTGWRGTWESQGMYAAVVMVLKASPLTAMLELTASALFVLLFTGYLLGCRVLSRAAKGPELSRPRVIALLTLALLPLYIFATSEVSADMLSRYRYPCEFAICILAVLGGSAIRRGRS